MGNKLLTVAVPCYNSAAFMSKCIDSLLKCGPEVEILIVDDGSADDTLRIAREYEGKYPDTVRAIHQENKGHGGAVNTGLFHAQGAYFKVVDSDDWLDETAYGRLLLALKGFEESSSQAPDMIVCNYVYEKPALDHRKVIRYTDVFPQDRVFGWEETKPFGRGQYLLMHAVVYKTDILRASGLSLPEHTFYVDNLFVYVPMAKVQRMYYMDVDLYRYQIGIEGQSVQENIMIRRIDQQLLVNRIMIDAVDVTAVESAQLRLYLFHYLEIVTAVSSAMLVRANTKEATEKKTALWMYMQEKRPDVYQVVGCSFLGRCFRLRGIFGHLLITAGYRIAKSVFGFN